MIDYETLETIIGNRLRTADNYDLDNAHFFPVSFLDRLFHFAQDLSIVENRCDSSRQLDSWGEDFDRWIDDMAATARVTVRETGSDKAVTAQLIDIESMTFNTGEAVTAVMTDGRQVVVLDDDSGELKVSSPDGLDVEIIQEYERQSEPLKTLEYLASVFFRASRMMKTEISNATAPVVTESLFRFFKYDLVPLIPDLMEDLEQIADEQLIRLRLTAKKVPTGNAGGE